MAQTDGKQSTGKSGRGPDGNTFSRLQKGDPGLIPRKSDVVYGGKSRECNCVDCDCQRLKRKEKENG
ncbi:hypothetical protein ACFL0S_06090 [Thermodesulfobacteriota bacterium]